jgi:hypothetical protein
MMIDINMVDKALDYLRTSASIAAKARAERLYLEEFKKSKRALLMSNYLDQPVNAQEREALSDPEYLSFLEVLRGAIEADENNKFKREAAQALIEGWRTQCSNLRAEGKAYV